MIAAAKHYFLSKSLFEGETQLQTSNSTNSVIFKKYDRTRQQ